MQSVQSIITTTKEARLPIKENIMIGKELRQYTKEIMTTAKVIIVPAKAIIAPVKVNITPTKQIMTPYKAKQWLDTPQLVRRMPKVQSGAILTTSTFAAHWQGKNREQPCQRAASTKHQQL